MEWSWMFLIVWMYVFEWTKEDLPENITLVEVEIVKENNYF